MSYMTCTSRTKFIAKVMLFFWLFSLAVGVANACVLQQGRFDAPMQDRRGELQSLQSADQAVVAAPMPGMSGAHDPRAPDASQQACKSFCESEQSAVAKTKPLVLSDAPPMVVSVHTWQALDVATADTTWRLADAAPPPGLPVAIRFLRLTL
jgi:hypothetical protein